MAKELFLVRHGETLFNVKRLMQGWSDSPLTEEGVAQARRAGAYLRRAGIAFDHAYASTLTRTQRTIEYLTDMPYSCEDGLREWYFGTWEAERSDIAPARPWREFFVQFGGESQARVRARMRATLAGIMSREGHERVLAVSSGSAIRELIAEIEGDPDAAGRAVPGNCSIMRLTYDADRFELVETIDGKDQLRALAGS